MLSRAHSLWEVKSVDEDARIIEGTASTPELDRQGDRMSSEGAKFTLPLPLLWQHRKDQPIGHVIDAKVTKSGIKIRAQIAKGLLPFIDEAWALIKAGLVRGLSIGWLPIDAEFVTGELHVKTWEWLELSAVTVPANASANIALVKQIDAEHLAASGTTGASRLHASGVTDPARGTPRKARDAMTIKEQITNFENSRAAKAARLTTLAEKSADAGSTLDETEQQEFDTLDSEIEEIDKHLARLAKVDKINATKAAVVPNGSSAAAAATTRAHTPVVTVTPTLPPGIGFARMAMAKTVARLDHRYVLDVAKEMFPHDQRLHQHFEKATVAAGTTTNSVYASALVDQTNLASEFIEYLRPQTIIGKFGTNGIPSLRRVPFNIRIVGQTTGGTAYWVGEGAPKPVTGFEFSPTTLLYTKVAAIAVITQELARFSTPSAETLVRDALRDAVVERLDRDFVDPAEAGSANVQPASITNGLTAQSSAGTSADNARTDIGNLLEAFIAANVNPASLVLIMPNTLALALSLMVNSLGQSEFPGLTMNGGTLLGIPVITSQYAANASGAGNLVIAVNASDIFLADDGAVTVDMSTEASLQMLDNPTNNSATGTATTMVSLWQTNSIGLRAERFINWAKRRSSAVVYMDDVNWGSIGSPA